MCGFLVLDPCLSNDQSIDLGFPLRKQLATRDVDECNECDTDEELDSPEAEAVLPAVATATAESPGSPGSPGLPGSPGSPGDRGSGVMKEAKEALVRTGLMALEAQSDDELLGLAPRSQPTRRQNKTWQLEEARKGTLILTVS